MRGVTSIQTHDKLRSPNCGRHAVSVVDTVNSLSLAKGLLFRTFLMDKHVFGFPGSTSGSNLIRLGL